MPTPSNVIPITGYEHLIVDSTNALVLKSFSGTLRDVLAIGTLYDHASQASGATRMIGRMPVFAIPFGLAQEKIVVRHAVRGGLAGRLVRDRFLAPTRATRELATAFRLRLSGVPTPEVVAVVTYAAGPLLRRADIATRYIDGADLAAVFTDVRNDAQRRPILDAVVTLLTRLGNAGAQHQDLNLRNILITAGEQGYRAHVLDVDRVHFHVPGDPMVLRANLDRLVRSLRKWRARPEARAGSLPDADISYLALAATAHPA